MPFTFSHPAAVLPLKYLAPSWISLTGLVVGSVTPDFEYFIRMRDESKYSHTLAGLFWYDLPVALILSFLFHDVVRNSLTNNLPLILKSRLIKFNSFDWNRHFLKNWPVVAVSVIIGAASHLIWDRFTHAHGYFVDAIPLLKKTIAISGHHIPIFALLQHGGTVVGGIVVMLAILSFPKANNTNGNINFMYWATVILITTLIIGVMVIIGERQSYKNLVMTCISAGLISLILTPLIMKKGFASVP